MHRRKRWLLVVLAGLGAPTIAGCHQLRGVETAAAEALVSPEDERKIGSEIQYDLARKVTFVDDPVVTRYVAQVAAPLFAEIRAQKPDLALDLHVIDDPKTVNAFAIPGGHVYVESGLLIASDSDAELAGVLAHETGHVVLDHPARQMVAQFGLETLASIALGKDAALVEQLAAAIAAKGLLLANSRDEENEADRFGVTYASRAHYDPQGLVRFLEKLKQGEKDNPAPPVWLSDHPTTERRIEDLTSYIAKNHLTGNVVGHADVQTIKSRLQKRELREPTANPHPWSP